MNLIGKTNCVLGSLERFLSFLAAVMLFLIMLIIATDVLLRYFFNSPLAWSYDVISMYLMVGLFFFSLSDTLTNNGHVCVDILHHRMPPRLRHATEMITYGCASLVFAGIVYMSAIKTFESFRTNEVISGGIPWPVWLSTAVVPIGAGLMLLRMVFRFIGHAVSLLANRPVIELPASSGTRQES